MPTVGRSVVRSVHRLDDRERPRTTTSIYRFPRATSTLLANDFNPRHRDRLTDWARDWASERASSMLDRRSSSFVIGKEEERSRKKYRERKKERKKERKTAIARSGRRANVRSFVRRTRSFHPFGRRKREREREREKERRERRVASFVSFRSTIYGLLYVDVDVEK